MRVPGPEDVRHPDVASTAGPGAEGVSLRALVVAWSLALSLWGPLALTMDLTSKPGPLGARGVVLLALLAVGAAATLVVGFLVGRRQLWEAYGWLLAVGTGVTIFWYDASRLASSDPISDSAADVVVGTLLLSPFIAGALTLALGVSGLLGMWVRQRNLPRPP